MTEECSWDRNICIRTRPSFTPSQNVQGRWGLLDILPRLWSKMHWILALKTYTLPNLSKDINYRAYRPKFNLKTNVLSHKKYRALPSFFLHSLVSIRMHVTYMQEYWAVVFTSCNLSKFKGQLFYYSSLK
jgi:hypothetical protein